MKVFFLPMLLTGLLSISSKTFSQVKIGYINMNDLIMSMSEFKKVDSSLSNYRNALEQQFNDYQKEYSDQQNILNSKDTLKYSREQLEIKRKQLYELLSKLQGFNQVAQQQLEQKKQELMAPVQKRALDLIEIVEKENGYSMCIEKDVIYGYHSPADDLLPMVRKKLGIK